jgi:hypothetical protein
MSDPKLFRVVGAKAEDLTGSAMELEKKLQNHLIEANMETFFGVRLLASEYSTGRKHRGQIDSIIDPGRQHARHRQMTSSRVGAAPLEIRCK